jgi:hypothetical protein
MADAKTTALSQIPALADSDLFYGVDDVGGTPASSSIAASTIRTYIGAGFTMTDTLEMADERLSRPYIRDYALQVSTPSNVSGTLTIDMSQGNVFSHTMTADITTLTITNAPATGRYGALLGFFTQHASSSFSISYGAAYRFQGGTHHEMSAGADNKDQVHFETIDGGITWLVTFVNGFS